MWKWLVGKFAPAEVVPIGVRKNDGTIDYLRLDAGGNIPVSVTGAGSGGTSSNFGAAFPLAGTAAGASDGANMQPLLVDGSGNLKTVAAASVSASSALTNVAENVASVTLLAANAARLAMTIFNDSDGVLLVKCGAVASATSFTARVQPRASLRSSDLGVNYTGRLDGIWETAPGTAGHASARVTELT